MSNIIEFEHPEEKPNIIKVIGVGGGGSNAVTHMFTEGICGVDFILCNTDSQALQRSPVVNKVHLGNVNLVPVMSLMWGVWLPKKQKMK